MRHCILATGFRELFAARMSEREKKTGPALLY